LSENSSFLFHRKKIIETALLGLPGGVHIIVEGTHQNGQQLITKDYHCSTKKLCAQ
jgi:hypothetical protein